MANDVEEEFYAVHGSSLNSCIVVKMTVISKSLFYEKINKDFSCKNIWHSWSNECFYALLYLNKEVIKGTGKFYFAIYLAQTLIKWKKINKAYLTYQLMSYLRSILYGISFATLMLGSNCLATKIFGRLHYFSFGFLPGIFGGCSIFVESKINRVLNTITFSSMCVEAIARYLQENKVIRRTATGETLTFMACSAFIMYLLQSQGNLKNTINLWFYDPVAKRGAGTSDENNFCCRHKYDCRRYVFDGFTNYFVFGYCFNLLKTFIPRFTTALKAPKLILFMLVNKRNFLFGLLIGSYVGVYRSITCFLKKKSKYGENLHALIAGFLSGIVYSIKPSFQILILSITTVLQLLILKIEQIRNLQEKLPLMEMLFIVCNGFLLHNRLLAPSYCPNYYKNMLNAATNGLINKTYDASYANVFMS